MDPYHIVKKSGYPEETLLLDSYNTLNYYKMYKATIPTTNVSRNKHEYLGIIVFYDKKEYKKKVHYSDDDYFFYNDEYFSFNNNYSDYIANTKLFHKDYILFYPDWIKRFIREQLINEIIKK